METFVGDTVKIILKTDIDVSGFDTLSISFRRPDGTTGSWDADLSPTNDEWIEYTTLVTDLDQSGIWTVQAAVSSLAGQVLHGKWAEFVVYDIILVLLPT